MRRGVPRSAGDTQAEPPTDVTSIRKQQPAHGWPCADCTRVCWTADERLLEATSYVEQAAEHGTRFNSPLQKAISCRVRGAGRATRGRTSQWTEHGGSATSPLHQSGSNGARRRPRISQPLLFPNLHRTSGGQSVRYTER